MIPVLSDNKALECDELVITTSEVGTRTFLVPNKPPMCALIYYCFTFCSINTSSFIIIYLQLIKLDKSLKLDFPKGMMLQRNNYGFPNESKLFF